MNFPAVAIAICFASGIAMALWPMGREPCIFTGILFRRIGCDVSPDRRRDISSVSRTFASGHVPLAGGLAGSRLLCRIYRATAQTKKLRFERSQLRRTRFARAASLARHTP